MNTIRTFRTGSLACLFGLILGTEASGEVTFTSPGFAPTKMDDQGRLVEDWGTLGIQLRGPGIPTTANWEVKSTKLDSVIPATEAKSQQGSVAITTTAFRAPVWPSGIDIYTVRMEEKEGQDKALELALMLPDTVRVGLRSVTLGGRAVVSLPEGSRVSQATRDWGCADDAVALPGWARPAVDCDPAFRNIRAGMGGVPIHYQFKVEPRARQNVVLGFCESHWDQAGQRPVICEVEGTAPQEVDPLARWGQHQPGVVLFEAVDANGDGVLTVSVLPKPAAPDQNPILNAIWLFAPETKPRLSEVVAGKLNNQAVRYVSVGGSNDQSLYAGGRVQYAIKLPANAVQEMTFMVASPGSSLPAREQMAWTSDKLRQAATAVWRDWR